MVPLNHRILISNGGWLPFRWSECFRILCEPFPLASAPRVQYIDYLINRAPCVVRRIGAEWNTPTSFCLERGYALQPLNRPPFTRTEPVRKRLFRVRATRGRVVFRLLSAEHEAQNDLMGTNVQHGHQPCVRCVNCEMAFPGENADPGTIVPSDARDIVRAPTGSTGLGAGE